MARSGLALAALLCALVLGGGAGTATAKQDFETRVDAYPPAKRERLRAHLTRALSRLEGPRREFAVAAAVNSYVFQHLRNVNVTGDGATALESGKGLCGSAALAMQELLYLAGVRSRYVVLLGVPYQGNHAQVQVRFSNGRSGLFDPTFGAFWYSRRYERPVPLARLLADPARSSRTLFKSVGRKRVAAEDPVVPIESVGSGYALRQNFVARSPTGATTMDFRRAFAENGGAGLANTGRPLALRIRIRPGDFHGVERWDGTTSPTRPLLVSKDYHGAFMPWPHVLGTVSPGFLVAHSYRMRNLTPRARYVVRIALSRSRGARLSARLWGSRRALVSRRLPELSGPPVGRTPPTVEIPFTARRSAARMRVAVTGAVEIQAVGLRRIRAR